MTDATSNPPQKDKLVKVYLKMRDAREQMTKKYKAEYEKLTAQMDQVEGAMLMIAQAQGETGFKTEFGTAFTETETQVSIADANAFYQFVLQQGDLDFFQRRVSTTHVTDYMKTNGDAVPPGLNLHRRLRMKVRSPSKKVTDDTPATEAV